MRRKVSSRAPNRAGDSASPNEVVAFHSLPVAGILGAIFAALAGLFAIFLVIFVVWLLAAHGDESTLEVVRASAVAWLATHLVPVVIGGNPLGLLPWAFALVPIQGLRKAMFWAIKSSRPRALYEYWLLAGFVTLGYSTVALLLSMFAGTPDLFTKDIDALTHTLMFATLVTGSCIWQDSQAHVLVVQRTPKVLRDGIRPGLVAAMILLFCGALVCTASLIMQFQQVRAVTGLIAPNSVDALFLTALGIGYIPTVVVWTTAYLIGPGIYIGSDSVISLATAYQGRLPAFPLLAVLPTQPPRYGAYVILIPILAGIAMFFATVRERWVAPSPSFLVSALSSVRVSELVTMATSVLTLGGVIFIASSASAGPLGLTLLDYVGPHAGQVARSAMAVAAISALTMLIVPRVLLSALRSFSGRNATEQ